MQSPEEQMLELREEELLVHREMRDLGVAHIRTHIEEVPARIEVDAFSEEVEVEHVPVGEVVSERGEPYQEGDTLVVPVYEEQLVVTKRLLLREQLRIRRVRTTQRQLFEDTLRRERADIDDPSNTGLVHERYPDGTPEGVRMTDGHHDDQDVEHDREEGGLVNLVRRALQ
ncbi:MAG TPA: DUF2382 domain-containing protein [Chloroflexota bacterium]|nr:DUF2382 domain-containing protein [Chloroflexota bacterium]